MSEIKKVVDKDVKDLNRESADEIIDKIAKMESDREAKLKAAKKQLVEMIEITADKYRTATGTAEAYRILRFIYGEQYNNIEYLLKTACRLAHEMADITQDMAYEANELSYENMDKLCNKYYNKDFDITGLGDDPDVMAFDLANEMMSIDLCRNVGGAAEDIVSFYNRSQEEIDSSKAALDNLGNE